MADVLRVLGDHPQHQPAQRVTAVALHGADVLAVSCPYEIFRFEDALKVIPHEKPMVVRDVSELLAEAMGD